MAPPDGGPVYPSPGRAGEQEANADGLELFVIEGSLADDAGRHGRRSWLRLPAG